MQRIKYILNNPNNSFNILINTDIATYNFFINIADIPKITKCIVKTGNYEASNYEFKSQTHAWDCFSSKIKKYVH